MPEAVSSVPEETDSQYWILAGLHREDHVRCRVGIAGLKRVVLMAKRGRLPRGRRRHMDAIRSRLNATIVKPEQALPIKPFGLDMHILLTSEATGGAISVIIAAHEPGEGPPDHVHFNQEEMFFIVEGTYELTVGDQTSTAGPGTIVFIPRNVVHRFKNVGDTTACMLDWTLPGGQDHYFKAISELAAGDGFTGEKVMEISKRFDTNFPVAQ